MHRTRRTGAISENTGWTEWNITPGHSVTDGLSRTQKTPFVELKPPWIGRSVRVQIPPRAVTRLWYVDFRLVGERPPRPNDHKMIAERVKGPAIARGSVFKRSGGWAYKVDTGFHPETGKRRQSVKQGFRTKREAENALAGVQNTVIDGTVVVTTGMGWTNTWTSGWRARKLACVRRAFSRT